MKRVCSKCGRIIPSYQTLHVRGGQTYCSRCVPRDEPEGFDPESSTYTGSPVPFDPARDDTRAQRYADYLASEEPDRVWD